MRFNLDNTTFNQAASEAAKHVGVGMHSGITIVAAKDGVSISASDTWKGFTQTIAASVERKGHVVMAGKQLAAASGRSRGDLTVCILAKRLRLEHEGGVFVVSMHEDSSIASTIPTNEGSLLMSPDDAAWAAAGVAHVRGGDDRFKGTEVRIEDNRLHFTRLDGIQLSRRTIDYTADDGTSPPTDALLPDDLLTRMMGLSGEEGVVNLGWSASWWTLEHNDRLWWYRAINNELPDVSVFLQMAPKLDEDAATCDAAELRRAIRDALVMNPDHGTVKLVQPEDLDLPYMNVIGLGQESSSRVTVEGQAPQMHMGGAQLAKLLGCFMGDITFREVSANTFACRQTGNDHEFHVMVGRVST